VTEDLEVSIAGARLAVRKITPDPVTEGAPTLVFLHEGLGSMESWRTFPAELSTATGCPVLLYDRLGYGRSDARNRRWDIDYLRRYALEELPAVLAECDVQRPLPMGHSDGGTIALMYAAEHPVPGLIAESAHVHVEDAALRGIRATIGTWVNGDLEDRLARYHGSKTHRVFWDWADTWLAPWFRNWSIEPQLDRVACPALLLQGADDEYATAGHLDLIADGLGGSVRAVLIPDCGHAPHLQAAGVAMGECVRFVNEVKSEG
jgi:pimeloyl-ACP methyl ester carboxylesterase